MSAFGGSIELTPSAKTLSAERWGLLIKEPAECGFLCFWGPETGTRCYAKTRHLNRYQQWLTMGLITGR
ncbi:hypothetical protein FH968_01010 [Buttiauxella sp. B2]|uniref:hypothetical protein n=1 Tax=Buttiauxella sp. B2 TaxID=2587812 RepID=UPI00112253FA|nr:hypothetical protein [Buttiauxella sp. B2]TNV22663.1 hypothetical protein FH968_01010 [Buttiauxella sp. B2]